MHIATKRTLMLLSQFMLMITLTIPTNISQVVEYVFLSTLYFVLISKSMHQLFAFSGLLIAKKKLFRNPVPGGCGGGTVLFVSS